MSSPLLPLRAKDATKNLTINPPVKAENFIGKRLYCRGFLYAHPDDAAITIKIILVPELKNHVLEVFNCSTLANSIEVKVFPGYADRLNAFYSTVTSD